MFLESLWYFLSIVWGEDRSPAVADYTADFPETRCKGGVSLAPCRFGGAASLPCVGQPLAWAAVSAWDNREAYIGLDLDRHVGGYFPALWETLFIKTLNWPYVLNNLTEVLLCLTDSQIRQICSCP